MTVAFKTFGCRLNRAEALELEARYQAEGWTVLDLSHTTAIPDRIVVRGCSVTARAQRDCEHEIAHLRARFPSSEIKITGCLPPPLSHSSQSPHALRGSAPPRELMSTPNNSNNPPIPLTTSRAYLKVQDGCSGRCAFCIVPQFRGPPVSVPFDDVLARARAFLAAGFHELVVTGCNLALYRSQNHGLPDLLSALADLSTSHRIRLGSLEPGICDDALLDALAAHANICRFVHLSLQSGSDAVLERMNRPYRIGTVARFCANAIARLGPRLSLGADVIAGFPGETTEDHLLSKQFLSTDRNLKPHTSNLNPFTFSNLHVFPYSERPGTPAATMDGALPRAIRLARARDLEDVGRRQRLDFARSFVGTTVEVCVERGGLRGWTGEYLPCRLNHAYPRRSLVTACVQDIETDTRGNLKNLLALGPH